MSATQNKTVTARAASFVSRPARASLGRYSPRRTSPVARISWYRALGNLVTVGLISSTGTKAAGGS
jgi:hypothetical protein